MKETCACWLASPASSATSTPAASPPPGPRHPAVRPRFGDAGQLFDPLPGLPRRQDAAHLPGHWQRHLLAAPPHRPRQIRRHHRPTLRRPPRHGHRLRRPSHRVPRLRPATRPARRALRPGGGRLPPPAPTRPSRPDLAARPHHRRRTPAQARRRPHPLLVTGASGNPRTGSPHTPTAGSRTPARPSSPQAPRSWARKSRPGATASLTAASALTPPTNG